MENDIIISLGGRAAEEIIFGEENITTGASGDIDRATEIVLAMVKRYGMNKNTGLLNYDVFYSNSFNNINEEIMSECKIKMESLYTDVKRIIADNMDKLDKLAQGLLTNETLGEEEINAIMVL
jgi:cell division protease FtsH